MVRPDVLADCRQQAQMRMERRVSLVGAALMVAGWLVILTWLALLLRDLLT